MSQSISQQSPQVGGASVNDVLDQMTDAVKSAALRFCLTCEDNEGYDIPKSMMKRLSALGLVKHKGFGYYEQENLLLSIRDSLEAWNAERNVKNESHEGD